MYYKMPGGIIQLVARGVQDMFISDNPQITFFKMVYRRHTNFSIEQVPQTFTHTANFGKKVSCIVSRSGDLIGSTFLVITLPQIPQLYNSDGTVDDITKFSWIRKIGFGIIKEIEIEIGGQSIDKHYGEWLNIWSDIVGSKNHDINNAIGNIKIIYDPSSSKPEFKLFIPLQFWFCRESGLALPILCLQYNDVKINLELQDLTKCQIISPTHYLVMDNDIVNFQTNEYIFQTVNNLTSIGKFIYFDELTKKLYYDRITPNSLLAINNTSYYSLTDFQKQQIKDTYAIIGKSSGYSACPQINTSSTQSVSVAHTHNTYNNIRVKECFLLINYVFLDEEERSKFYKANHEFIIDQLIYVGESSLDGVNRLVRIGLTHPCKLMVWLTQFNYLLSNNNNDIFNYTDSPYYDGDTQLGDSIIKNSTILLNGQPRMENMNDMYYNCVQSWQYFRYNPSKGLNIYSFGLIPDKTQPSGACNMSKIDNVQISLALSSSVSTNNPVKFRCYGLVMNVFRVISGVAGIVFIN